MVGNEDIKMEADQSVSVSCIRDDVDVAAVRRRRQLGILGLILDVAWKNTMN
jgi:hypothetical protein